MKQFRNYINGKEVAARDGRTTPVIDPVTGKQYAEAALSSAADVDDAMQAAAAAFESWKNTTPSMRQKAINDIADAMEAHMDELIEAFSLEKVSKSGAKFDVQKAFWFNQQYLQKKSAAEVVAIIRPQVSAANYDVCDEYLEQVVNLMREKVQFAKDIVTEGDYFFKAPGEFDQDVVAKKWKPETGVHIEGIRNMFAGLSDAASAIDYENAFKNYCEKSGVKTGELLQPLRLAVSGKGAGAPIWEMIALIGRDFILERLEFAVKKISFS
jgi:glutamyl/glutaminyl-tRNA synthetase